MNFRAQPRLLSAASNEGLVAETATTGTAVLAVAAADVEALERRHFPLSKPSRNPPAVEAAAADAASAASLFSANHSVHKQAMPRTVHFVAFLKLSQSRWLAPRPTHSPHNGPYLKNDARPPPGGAESSSPPSH